MSISEPVYIKDAIAKCVVEIVKREWPQQWPTFIDEMSFICSVGQAEKTDSVMRIFLRLAEDVVILNTIQPAQRRKEIQAALNKALIDIVPFIINSLESNIAAYNSNIAAYNSSSQEFGENLLKVTKSTLNTVMGYVGWCDANLVNAHNNKLIPLLIAHLSDEGIQLECAECLLVITQRHGNAESISPVLVMFFEECLDSLSRILQLATDIQPNPKTHNFLKRFSQAVISMGDQLSSLWTKEGDKFSLPSTFPRYMQILSVLSSHPSLFISSACFECWSSLIKFSPAQTFLSSVASDLSTLCYKKLQKVGAPSDPSHPSSYYARLDYDSEANWVDHYHRSKSAIFTVLQSLWKYNPDDLRNLSVSEINRLLTITQQQFPSDSSVSCDKSRSPLYLEWETLNSFLHALSKELTHPSLCAVFQTLLNTTVKEPQLLSIMLSVLSALLYALPSLPQPIIELMLRKIFMYVQYRDAAYPNSHNLDLSRHAGSVFIKLATLHSSLLMTKFGELHEHITRSRPNLDGRTNRCLTEGLLLVSNEMKQFDTQVDYILIVLDESLRQWNDEHLQQSLQGPIEMASYIGLLSSPDSSPVFRDRRFQMQELIRDFGMVARRVTVPTDPSALTAGGYIHVSGIVKSPAANILLPLLNRILQCLHSTLGLCKAEAVKQFNDAYPPSTVHQLPENERVLLIGHQITEEKYLKGEGHYIQKHILDVTDSVQQVLIFLSKSGSHLFYKHANLAEMLSQIVLHHINEVNAFLFKSLVKGVVKSLCLNCPAELRATFVPSLLNSVLPPIVNKLNAKWQNVQYLAYSNGTTSGVEENEERPEDEIIEEELLRLTSRELLDMCTNLFIAPAPSKPTKKSELENSNSNGDVEMSTNELSVSHLAIQSGHEPLLTDYVKGLPQEEVLYLLWLSTTCICWMDSLTCFKSIDLILPLTRHLMGAGSVTYDIAEQVVKSLLTSVHLSGQHDFIITRLLSCILSVYEMLRPVFTGLADIFLQVPGVTPDKLTKFESDVGLHKIMSTGEVLKCSQASSKKKRESLKSLISQIVGKNVSEQFRENIVIKNLPPLVKSRLQTTDIISCVSDSETLGLCQMFIPS